MEKKFFKLLLLIIFICDISYAEIINDIKIFGNKRISNETVLVLGEISKGQDFDDNSLNNTLKKLYQTNFFSNVDLSIANNILTINLEENPIIEDIEITGLKNSSFIEKIADSINLKNRMSFTEDQLKEILIL